MQQVGSPLELYQRPRNRFVASFIGSPAMNFIDMDVTAAADTFSLSANGIAIELPQRRFAGSARMPAAPSRWACVPSTCGWDRPTAANTSASAAT